jgi:V8-like Glu-specific endopeptidase
MRIKKNLFILLSIITCLTLLALIAGCQIQIQDSKKDNNAKQLISIIDGDEAFNIKMQDPDNYFIDKEELSLSRSICGSTNDMQHVNMYDGTLGVSINFVHSHSNPVGAMETASYSKYCSGTLISADLFITASHCVDNGTTNDYVSFNYEKDANGNNETQDHRKIIAVVEDGRGGLDYAIVRLKNNPGNKWGWTSMSTNMPNVNNRVTIIQHPSGYRKRIESGIIGSKTTNKLYYKWLDTKPGSSGSGILNNNGQLVGVHTNGGCTASGGSNSGYKLNKIYNVSPTIQNLFGGGDDDDDDDNNNNCPSSHPYYACGLCWVDAAQAASGGCN